LRHEVSTFLADTNVKRSDASTGLLLCTVGATLCLVSSCEYWISLRLAGEHWATLSNHKGRGTVCPAGLLGGGYLGVVVIGHRVIGYRQEGTGNGGGADGVALRII
jgi:hypothetical protein